MTDPRVLAAHRDHAILMELSAILGLFHALLPHRIAPSDNVDEPERLQRRLEIARQSALGAATEDRFVPGWALYVEPHLTRIDVEAA